MQVFAELGKLSKEERPAVGAAANRVKGKLEATLTERTEAIKAAALAKSLEEEQLDVTLPGRAIHMGRLHPSTQQLRRVLDILADMKREDHKADVPRSHEQASRCVRCGFRKVCDQSLV